MNIETKAAKQGLKLGAKLLEAYRKWRTRIAWKRNALKRPAALAAILLVGISSGCANLDNAYIKMDDRLFDGSQNPNRYLVPEGYEVRAFVRDAAGDRVDIAGWTVEEEMTKTDSWTPRPLVIDARGRKQSSVINDVVDAIREQRTEQPASANGAQAAIDIIKGAAND